MEKRHIKTNENKNKAYRQTYREKTQKLCKKTERLSKTLDNQVSIKSNRIVIILQPMYLEKEFIDKVRMRKINKEEQEVDGDKRKITIINFKHTKKKERKKKNKERTEKKKV